MAHEGSIVMPFGKHKGVEVCDIPTSYLDWLIGQAWFITRFTDLAEEIARHLRDRPDWAALGEPDV